MEMTSRPCIAVYGRWPLGVGARVLLVAIGLACGLHPIWGQPAWQTCGSGLCASTGANVAIGTTNAINNLVVQGAGISLPGTAHINASFLQDQAVYRGVGLGYDTSASIGIVAGSSGGGPSQLAFWNANNSGVWGEKVRIDPSGNVGIGTSNTINRF